MTWPKFAFLKSPKVFLQEAVPDMQVKDLARLPLTDPFAKAVLQRLYLGWKGSYEQLVQPDLTDAQTHYWRGRAAAYHAAIVDLEHSHETARSAVETR